MIGDYLESNAPDPLAEATAVLDERLEQTQIAAEALRELEQEADEARGPLVVESFSVAELARMSPEDRAAALAEFEEQAALAATASGELVEAGLGELGEDDQTEADLSELDDLDDGDEPEFDHVDADVDDEGDEDDDRRDESAAAAELAAVRDRDSVVIGILGEEAGYTVDSATGRPMYDILRDKVAAGRATRDESEQLGHMTLVREIAGPVYRGAEQHILRNFSATFDAALAHAAAEVGASADEVQAVKSRGLDSLARYALVGERAWRQGRVEPPASADRSRHSERAARPARHEPASTAPAPARVRMNAPEGQSGGTGQRRSTRPDTQISRILRDPRMYDANGFPTDELDALVKRGALLA